MRTKQPQRAKEIKLGKSIRAAMNASRTPLAQKGNASCALGSSRGVNRSYGSAWRMRLTNQQRLVVIRGQSRRYGESSLLHANLEVRLLRRLFRLYLRCLLHFVPRKITQPQVIAIGLPPLKFALRLCVVNSFILHHRPPPPIRSKINRHRLSFNPPSHPPPIENPVQIVVVTGLAASSSRPAAVQNLRVGASKANNASRSSSTHHDG